MIAGNNKGVAVVNDFITILFYFFFVPFPDFPKFVHGFVHRKGQMHISQSI